MVVILITLCRISIRLLLFFFKSKTDLIGYILSYYSTYDVLYIFNYFLFLDYWVTILLSFLNNYYDLL